MFCLSDREGFSAIVNDHRQSYGYNNQRPSNRTMAEAKWQKQNLKTRGRHEEGGWKSKRTFRPVVEEMPFKCQYNLSSFNCQKQQIIYSECKCFVLRLFYLHQRTGNQMLWCERSYGNKSQRSIAICSDHSVERSQQPGDRRRSSAATWKLSLI